jgi:hypothetical protein
LLSSWYQGVFALFVPSCCDKSGTSCYHLVTRLMTVTDLLQVVPTRLIQAVRNKLPRACCHQLVNKLLRADDIGVSTSLQDDNNLFQTTQQRGTSSANTSCWRAVRLLRVYTLKNAQVVTSLQQTCSNVVPTTCEQDVFTSGYKVVELNRLVTSCSNNLLSSCNSTICQQVVSDNLVATW